MQSYIIYRKDMALRLTLTILICILLMLFSIYYLKSNSLAFIFCIVVILPLLFIKPIMKKFTRRINIKLQKNFFSVAIIKNDNEDKMYEDYPLNQISTYNIQFPTRKFSAIKLNLKKGKSLEYSFFKEKQFVEQTDTEELLKSFQAMIKNYNNMVSTKEQILFVPSFIASFYGLISIVVMVALLSAAILIHILYQVKTLPITLFFGFTLIIQLMLKRKSDLDYYNKMR